jgi:hypothetical protein
MNPRFFTKTFTRFFVGFLCIIAAAFTVMAVAGQYAPHQASVDNTARPQ